MKRNAFRTRLRDEILILDGAMGTSLQPHLPPGASMDGAVLSHPDLVRSVHKAYADAGADILSTNTFQAARGKLTEFGLGAECRRLNEQAARLAREAAGDRTLVAGTMGPTGRLVEPLGEQTFDETYALFREQAEALAAGGVDLFLLETFGDLKEIRIAIIAIRDVTAALPILASMTYEDTFTSYTGTDPETAASVLSALDIDALGVNCSTGPAPMLEVLGRYAMETDLPLFVEPNAGIPRLDEKGTTYQVSPEEMAGFAERFVQIGAGIIGSCCGSTPAYTRLIRSAAKGLRPVSRSCAPVLRLASRVKRISIGAGMPFCVIGERINPTNRDDLAASIESRSLAHLLKEGETQVREGAHMLDVNIGVAGFDEASFMGAVVRGVENSIPVPLSIDTTNPGALEAALKESAGKPLINSVNASPESMEQILPMARRYGAGLLCLAVGEKGIPKTADERIAILERIIQEAEKHHISREHLICDCLTLTVSAQQKRAEATLRAVQRVRDDLGLPTVLGVSNISFGLPERSLINSVFISMAMAAGLDAAIINPGDIRVMDAIRAASVLTVRDKDSRAFVEGYQKKKPKKAAPVPDAESGEPGSEIYQAVLSGNREDVDALVRSALDQGLTPLKINNDILIPAIEEVGRRYDRKTIFLPQMILAAETMQRAFAVLEPLFKSGEREEHGRILLCTVKGDVHDIGKNIVSLFLKNQGFTVKDMGKDVSAEAIVEAVREFRAHVVGLSALMTTTMVEMEKVIKALSGLETPPAVVVGGAVVTKKFARDIGASGYAADAASAVEMIHKVMRGEPGF